MMPASQDPGSLDRLNDIVTADPVGWWPLAPGWMALASIFAASAATGIVLAVRRWFANRYRREALAELRTVQSEAHEQTSAVRTAHVASLLKRTALAAGERTEIAGLSGRAWLAFLDRTGNTQDFTTGPGRVLETAAYSSRLRLDNSEFTALCACVSHWISTHDLTRGEAQC